MRESHPPGLRDIIIRQDGRYGNQALHLDVLRAFYPGVEGDAMAARMNSPLEADEGIPVADMVHWCHPSAEMVAESREVELCPPSTAPWPTPSKQRGASVAENFT